MKSLLLGFFSFFITHGLVSQFSVQGTITDNDGQAIEFANVVLYEANT